jgi:hypothetical protein
VTSYIVRPELRGDPPLTTYMLLHAFLATLGFVNEADGLRLPHATYFGRSNKTADELSAELKVAITREVRYDVTVAVAPAEFVSVDGRTGGFAFQLARYAADNANLSSMGVNHLANIGAFFDCR